MPNRFLVTAAVPYSNGKPHVGHIAGAYLPADTYVRYRRAVGDEVLFICGSDDNGVAAMLAAQKEGLSPAELVAKYHAIQKASFDGLGIAFDVYGGTHHPDYVDCHTRFSQHFFKTIWEKGYFTKRTSEQLYDLVAQQFLPDRYVVGTCYFCGYERANGDQCENCGREIEPAKLRDPKSVLTGTTPELRETVHWYLRLADFQEPLRQWLESHNDWRPVVLNQSLARIQSEGLPERAMTRDLSWGVPVPLDDPDAAGKVLYVWFDAPIGYVSFTAKLLADRGGSEEDYAQWWKSPETQILHFIGEDNIIFHALIWPAMMLAEGTYQLPRQVVANSFLNIRFPGKEDEEKISKSRGTAIWIDEYLETHDPDPLRYYLTAIAPEGARTAFQPDEFVLRNDGELVAALGNFVNRNIAFAHKYFEGKVPNPGVLDEVDHAMLAACGEQQAKAAAEIEAFHFRQGLAEVMQLARLGNRYLDQKKPWVQRKEDLAACGQTIAVCLAVIRALAVLMRPYLPFSSEKTIRMLGLPHDAWQWSSALEPLPPGHPLGPPEMLFRKLAEEIKGSG